MTGAAIVLVLWALASVAVLFVILGWAWLVLFRPRRAWRLLYPRRTDMSRLSRWLSVAATVLWFVGLFAILYSGLSTLLAWIPDSWGYVDEGGYTRIGRLIAGLAAVALTLFLSAATSALLDRRSDEAAARSRL